MFKQLIDLYELFDMPTVSGKIISDYLKEQHAKDISVETITTDKGSTDFITVKIAGKKGKQNGGDAPTLGIIGRLGGIGARPQRIGYVSDGDGALAAIAIAAKLSKMNALGDILAGDVMIATHICPDAPTRPHKPVPFMDSPVDMLTMNKYEVHKDMDAILSIDTTKGNQVVNHRGFALSPTVMQGYILPVANDLLQVMASSTGKLPVTFPLSQQDITPYGNDLHHINSILQPAVAALCPIVGVAITAETAVAGCATGASRLTDIEEAARFCIEVAKDYTENNCSFYNEEEFNNLRKRYGSMAHFQTMGREKSSDV